MQIDKLKAKYGSTPNEQPKTATPSPAASTDPLYLGYGCGNCGNQEYRQTKFKMWQCKQCSTLYPFIAALKAVAPKIEKLAWVTPCPLCSSPWIMRSAKNPKIFFCVSCQDYPREEYGVLVCAGKKLPPQKKIRNSKS